VPYDAGVEEHAFLLPIAWNGWALVYDLKENSCLLSLPLGKDREIRKGRERRGFFIIIHRRGRLQAWKVVLTAAAAAAASCITKLVMKIKNGTF